MFLAIKLISQNVLVQVKNTSFLTQIYNKSINF